MEANKMKMTYEAPKLELIQLMPNDVIANSGDLILPSDEFE